MIRFVAILLGLSVSMPVLAQDSSSTEKPASQPAGARANFVPVSPSFAEKEQKGTTDDVLPPLPPLPPDTVENLGPDYLINSVNRQDVDARVELLRRDNFSLYIGGLLQVQTAFYVGGQASVQLLDPADQEGFQIRRARLAFGGLLLPYFSYYLAVDLKDVVAAALEEKRANEISDNEIFDVTVSWNRFAFCQVVVGLDKVPFSTFAMMSSSRQWMIERPFSVSVLTPGRRIGATIYGEVGNLLYAIGMYNGEGEITSGSEIAGFSFATHLQLNIWGQPTRFVPRELSITLAGGYMYDTGKDTNLHLASGSLDIRGWRIRLLGEFLWERSNAGSLQSGSLADDALFRWGTIGEINLFLWRSYVQAAVRFEHFQDNENLSTFHNQELISGGLNIYFCKHRLKLQTNYIRRVEKESSNVANIGFAQLQAMF